MRKTASIITFVTLLLSLQCIIYVSASEAPPANPTDGDVLYENDFSDGLPDDFRVVQGDSSKVYVQDGFLYLDGRGTEFLRVLLPEYLDQYGNYEITVRASLSEPGWEGRWNSVVFRAQSGNSLHYPYYQMCVRENTTATNGVEFAERNSSDQWIVRSTGSYIDNINPDSMYTYTVRAVDGLIVESVNGVQVIRTTPDSAYLTGGIGLQADYSIMKIDSIRVTYAVGDGNRLAFFSDSAFTLNTVKRWDGTLYYSTDLNSWTEWDGSVVNSSANGKLYLRGSGNTVITSLNGGFSTDFRWVLTGNSDIVCNGNIANLLDYATVAAGASPDMGDNCYAYLFSGCTNLTEAPALSATELTPSCYCGMFFRCAALRMSPALPAIELAEHCYDYMFSECTSFTETPALPATTLAPYCYQYMFRGCTGITKASVLPATTLTEGCYGRMFRGCWELSAAPELTATVMAPSCYYGMFSYCTSLTAAPELPATTLANRCYYYMFEECTGLISLPLLPATALADYCYSNMFRNCTGIKVSRSRNSEYSVAWRVPSSGTGTAATGWNTNMFYGTGGSFVSGPALNTVYYLSPYTISIDITWGAMEFEYNTHETWNSETHTWEQGAPTWEVKNNSNTVTVCNRSDVNLNAYFSFTKDAAYADIGGTFSADSVDFYADENRLWLSTSNPGGTVRFLVTGSIPPSLTDYTRVGVITISFGISREPD